jgi:Cof subfamily protein (haloacid dehalogenase superfamily)
MAEAQATGTQPVLYVTDLDGTLIRDDLSLSRWARTTLVSLLKAGVALTVATARSIVSLSAILGDMPFRLPVVEFGGAFLTDYRTKRHVLVNDITPDRARELHRIIAAAGMQPFLSTWDGTRDSLWFVGILNDGEKAYYQERLALRDDRLRPVRDLSPGLAEQVVAFTLIDREARLRELAATLSDRFGSLLQLVIYAARYSPGWHFLSILDERATKEGGIQALRKRHGLERASLVVFGDDVNDIGMFRVATHAVAVGNAREELKALAHETIGTNQEDSVLRWLRGTGTWRP